MASEDCVYVDDSVTGEAVTYLNCQNCGRSVHYLHGGLRVFFPNCTCDETSEKLSRSRLPDRIEQ